MKFGHHQSFHLRVNWLSKAIKMTQNDPRFFFDEYAFEKVGLGKNMVKSLRYWAVATSVFREKKDDQRQTVHELTPFGDIVARYDRFARQPLTIAVLHVELASNIEYAPTVYWYFNEFGMRVASNDEVLSALSDWTNANHSQSVSIKTLKRDIDCLRLMYTAKSNGDDPEEIVASPLSNLELLQDSKDQFIKCTPNLNKIDIDALFYTLLRFCERNNVNSLTLDEILIKPSLWGKLFNLSTSKIFDVLELLHMNPHYPLRFVQTNELFSVNIDVENSIEFLRKAYERKEGK
jgi:hypothetical protein